MLATYRNGWGGGWGGFGNRGDQMGMNSPAGQGALTRGDLADAFNFNNLERNMEATQNGIADATFALNNAITNGFQNNTLGMVNGFNAVQSQLQQNAADAACLAA